MGDILCDDHPEERLRFVCVPCDALICRDCKLTDHEGHKTIDVSKATAGLKDKLEDHRGRLEGRLRVLRKVTQEVEEDKATASQALQRLETRIKNRSDMLTSWIKEAQQSALNALKNVSLKVDANLSSTTSDLDRRKDEVQEMIDSINKMVSSISQSAQPGPSFDSVAALRLERDMRIGRGKGENLERLTEGLPNYSVLPTLHGVSNALSRVMVQRYIGDPLYTQLTKTTPKVALSPLFRCCSVPGACVNAVCPMLDGTVWIAHDVVEGKSTEQRVALYTSDGRVLREQKVNGRVNVARAFDDWVYVVGATVKKVMSSQETREAISERDTGSGRARKTDQPRQRFVHAALSKLNARFSIKTVTTTSTSSDKGDGTQDDAMICKIEARSLPSLWIVSETYFPVKALMPQAVDVDSTGEHFAVLLPEPAIKLYHPSHPNPVASYSPTSENFSPADVCFHVLNKTEVLLVADWFNSAIHVLDYKNKLRFQGYLGAGCPLLQQPTALTSDDNNRLWVGCKGGHILMCLSAELDGTEEENEVVEEEETPELPPRTLAQESESTMFH